MEQRITDVEERLDTLEKGFAKLRKTAHRVANSQTKLSAQMVIIQGNTNEILKFCSGATTVFGFARRHWKRAIAFGAGLFTAAGIGNPKVIQFVQHFFGL